MHGKAPTSNHRSEISREELRRRGPSLIVVDTLPAESYAAGHIPGAVSLPLADIPLRAAAVLPDRRAEIVVYCGSETCPVAGNAAHRLEELGYTNIRHYHGGLADWTAAGEPLEQVAPRVVASPDILRVRSRRDRARTRLRQRGTALLDLIDDRSPAQLLLIWLAMIVACSLAYWLAGLSPDAGLLANGTHLDTRFATLPSAIYFSFVTATSVGYGDVVPLGAVRPVAIAEAVTGLLIFGAVIAKFVSRRQDELVREIHRVTFEDRLDRVQTNLHLVLSEMQAIAGLCADAAVPPTRISARLESAALVFAGELRAVHDLLYRPQWAPEEAVLGAILASLAASLRELREVLLCMPPTVERSPTLTTTLATLARAADEICGSCVPHAYAPALTMWMDRIQEAARSIA